MWLTGHSHSLLTSVTYGKRQHEVAFPSTLRRGQWLVPRLVNKRGPCNVTQCWEENGALPTGEVLSYSSKGNRTPVYGPVEGCWQEINTLMQNV